MYFIFLIVEIVDLSTKRMKLRDNDSGDVVNNESEYIEQNSKLEFFYDGLKLKKKSK